MRIMNFTTQNKVKITTQIFVIMTKNGKPKKQYLNLKKIHIIEFLVKLIYHINKIGIF